mmetsp:Transcript_14985/g.45372  ORF Transcript_14985/g.45372 Transcript_14985/m.45372 type:complete len:105 (-) Transcript_14985:409-723(-)
MQLKDGRRRPLPGGGAFSLPLPIRRSDSEDVTLVDDDYERQLGYRLYVFSLRVNRRPPDFFEDDEAKQPDVVVAARSRVVVSPSDDDCGGSGLVVDDAVFGLEV